MRKSVIVGALWLASTAAFAQVPPFSGGPVPDQLDIMQSVVPGTTQTQAGAKLLTGTINVISPATASDGVILPACTRAPRRITVVNTSANAAKVYANGSETINGTAGATGVALNAGVTTEYICVKQGSAATWFSH